MSNIIKATLLSLATGLLLSCGCVGGGTCDKPVAAPANDGGTVATAGDEGGQCSGSGAAVAGKGGGDGSGCADGVATAGVAEAVETPKR